MDNPANRDLKYHHDEIARLAKVLATARQHSRRASLLRDIIKYHEEVIARVLGVSLK